MGERPDPNTKQTGTYQNTWESPLEYIWEPIRRMMGTHWKTNGKPNRRHRKAHYEAECGGGIKMQGDPQLMNEGGPLKKQG